MRQTTGLKRHRLGRWLGTTLAAASLAGGSLFIASTGVASATTSCGFGISGGNIRTCISGNSGVATSGATVISSARVLQSCVARNGVQIACSRYTRLGPGAGTGVTWVSGRSRLPDGTYCAVTWRSNGNGTSTRVAKICFGIGTTTIG